MLVLLFALTTICLASTQAETDKLFEDFITKYQRVYTNRERTLKRAIFEQNLKKVEELNKRGGSARYGITKFFDLSQEEFRATYLMPKKLVSSRSQLKTATLKEFPIDYNARLPASFDWRDKKAVTKAKDQGQCGSCWAFSATEAIESQWFLAGNNLTELSPQQIVDCDKGRGDEGCNGGDTPTAFEYVIAAGGMETESDYPYTGEDDTCAFSSSKVAAKIKSWTYITKNMNETEMQYKLFNLGPLSICVDASSWQFYFGGIIEYFCSSAPEDLDHCVVVTGYADRADWLGRDTPIWNVRNSWGSDWGYDGYLYIERGYNLCGVADEVTLPLVN
jgi:cathepsin F